MPGTRLFEHRCPRVEARPGSSTHFDIVRQALRSPGRAASRISNARSDSGASRHTTRRAALLALMVCCTAAHVALGSTVKWCQDLYNQYDSRRYGTTYQAACDASVQAVVANEKQRSPDYYIEFCWWLSSPEATAAPRARFQWNVPWFTCTYWRTDIIFRRASTGTDCPSGTVDPKTGQCLLSTGGDKDKGCTRDGVGNPCNAGTGNKFQAETDFQGPVFTFVRYYNSAETQDVGLGVGWSSRFQKRLEIDGSRLIVRRADGRGEPWTKSGGQWSGDPDSKLRLVEHDTGFTLTNPDGGTERYAATGRLLSETAPSARTTTYHYDAKGRLDTVQGPFGHRLAFTYDSGDHIQTVADPAGRVYTYGYDAHDNLVSVTNPDGTQRGYQYANPDFPHHLTGITDGNGDRFATFVYDARGRAVSTAHAATDNGAPQEQFTLDYQN